MTGEEGAGAFFEDVQYDGPHESIPDMILLIDVTYRFEALVLAFRAQCTGAVYSEHMSHVLPGLSLTDDPS